MLMDLPGTFEIVDVRPAAQFADFSLPGALNADIADVIANPAYLSGAVPLVVVDRDAMSQHLQRLLKAAGQKAPDVEPILELNPHHPLVQRLKHEDEKLADWAQLLLDQAQLAEGGVLEDPAGFVRRMNAMLLKAVG